MAGAGGAYSGVDYRTPGAGALAGGIAQCDGIFLLVPGRMVPAMLSAAAAQQARGTFVSLMSLLQMPPSGIASLVAGLINTRSVTRQIEHSDNVGYLAAASSFAALWIVQGMKAASEPDRVSDSERLGFWRFPSG